MENKIPNKILLVWLGLHSLQIHLVDGTFLMPISGGLALFSLGLVLYLMRAMSAGDVKLLGVVGFVIGLPKIPEALLFIVIASGLVAALYLFYNLSYLGVSNPIVAFTEPKLVFGGANYSDGNGNQVRYKNRLTMPFAPAVAVGLAMYFYFS